MFKNTKRKILLSNIDQLNGVSAELVTNLEYLMLSTKAGDRDGIKKWAKNVSGSAREFSAICKLISWLI